MSVNELVSPSVAARRPGRIGADRPGPRYASVLVHVEPRSTASDGRVALALDLARRFGATLVGMAAEGLQPPPVDAYGGVAFVGEMVEAEDEQVRADLQAARDRFATLSGSTELMTEWRSATETPVQAIAREARSADLIVIGRDLSRLREGIYRSADPGDLLMQAGRPLLVVPPGADSVRAEHIVVAWKDTREARRAVWDALPLLTRAASVHVVEIAAESELEAAASRVGDVASHLRRHGVAADAETRTRREASDADELILVAEQNEADLIVAGGYGHARLREWVLGGVTMELLRHCPKCCLLSH
jgi:nucleotide-binding universal stress UspA family protein